MAVAGFILFGWKGDIDNLFLHLLFPKPPGQLLPGCLQLFLD